MTIDELKKYCDGEFIHIKRIVDELYTVYIPDKAEYPITDKAAMAALLVNMYSGIEGILKQMLKFDKLDVDDSPGWHEMVLRKSAEIAILPPDLIQLLSKYLAFRNFFLYTYVFNINWDDMKSMIDAARDVVSGVHSEVEDYIKSI
ncbi:MAG: hypothetical protein JSW20_02950 [Nitrospiraceae bacterium]|nr:MAG: hypothetical protein JSW20_02950 [Nitrospiraceae bacterium]